MDKSGWKKYRFEQIASNISERVEPGATNLDIYVGLEHLDSDTIHIKRWGKPADVEGTKLKVYPGDLIFGKRRAYQRKAAIATFEGICSAHAMVLRANPAVIDPQLFPFFIHSDAFMHRAVDISVGSLSPTINWSTLRTQEFLLPPKDQQARLAELLWAGDAVVEGYGRTLTKLLDTQQAFSLHQYQDRTKPSSNLYSIAEINPRIPKDLRDNELTVSFLAMADVSDEGQIINHQKRKLGDVRKGFSYFAEGDILFAKITPCMENGKGALAEGLENGHGFGSTEFHVIRPFKESDRLYCFYLSQMDIFRKEAEKLMVGSAGQKRVQVDFFEYFSLHMPSEGKRQVFGEKMKSFEKERMRIKMLTENARLLQSTLLHQIFTS